MSIHRYKPRRIICPVTPVERKVYRENENLNALLEACEWLVVSWDGYSEDDMADHVERIREALVSLGRIRECA